MREFGEALAYFIKKVAAGTKSTPIDIRYILVKDRPNLGSPMRLGNMPIVEVGIYAQPIQNLTWMC